MKNHNSFQNTISQWCRKAKIPHGGGQCGTPQTCKGMFSAFTQPLRDPGLTEEDMKVLNKIIPTSYSTCRGRARPLRT